MTIMPLRGRTRVSFATALPLLFAIACDGGSESSAPASSSEPNDPESEPSSGGGCNGAKDKGTGQQGETTVPYVHFDVNHVLSTGQSNSVAIGAKEVLSSSQ